MCVCVWVWACGRLCVCVRVGSDVCLFVCVCVLYVGFGSTCRLSGSRPADSLDHRFGFFLCFPFSVLRVSPSLMRQQISVSSPDVELT